MGLPHLNQRSGVLDLLRLARHGENQTGRKLKCLQTDNGGEFKSDEFVKFYRERGIRREYTAPYSREQNGIAEHMNRTIQERVVSMLQHSGLSDGFWQRLYSRQ